MTENKFLIDSSAWIEYFQGTLVGQKVKKIVEDNENKVFTPKIVAAEVVSKIARCGEDTETAITAIKTLSILPNEELNYFFEAGKLHAELRGKIKDIRLADAIIKVLAEKNSAKIVTKDSHLKGKETIFID